MTCVTSARSSPRAATSVATSVDVCPDSKRWRPLPLSLVQVAVECDRVDLMKRELLHEAVGATPCPHEHEGEAALCAKELREVDTFSSGWTGTKRCSTCASSGVAIGATSQRTGSLVYAWASSPTAESRVAEKNIVCGGVERGGRSGRPAA